MKAKKLIVEINESDDSTCNDQHWFSNFLFVTFQSVWFVLQFVTFC